MISEEEIAALASSLRSQVLPVYDAYQNTQVSVRAPVGAAAASAHRPHVAYAVSQ